MRTIINKLKAAVLITVLTASTSLIAETKDHNKMDSSKKTAGSIEKGSIMSIPSEEGPIEGIENDNSLIKSLNIFPMPASRVLNIEFKNEDNGEVYIDLYNVSGQRVLSNIKANKNQTTTINIQKLDDGVYFLSLRSKIKCYKNKIIIKNT
jgi:hypothetical protein